MSTRFVYGREDVDHPCPVSGPREETAGLCLRGLGPARAAHVQRTVESGGRRLSTQTEEDSHGQKQTFQDQEQEMAGAQSSSEKSRGQEEDAESQVHWETLCSVCNNDQQCLDAETRTAGSSV